MEEEKAAAYYDELTRKGEGAARFKHGLGFSSSSSSSSSSSVSSKFVRASSPRKAAELQRQGQLESIQHKLRRNSDSRDQGQGRGRGRGRGRDRDDRRSGGSSSSRERWSDIDRDHRHDSRTSTREEEEGEGGRERRRRSRSRSHSPSRESRRGDRDRSHRNRSAKSKNSCVDYSQLIDGYWQMTPAERVKAKMKFQLSQTAAKDTTMSMNTGWERFDFNKDAPLDDEEEVEVAEDDALLVKVIGKSFRFSAAEAKREDEIKAAHDQAMFGAPSASLVLTEIASTQENDTTDLNENNLSDVLASDKVFAMQQASWRDRARRFQKGSGNQD